MKFLNTHEHKDSEMRINFLLYKAHKKHVNVNQCKIQNCL
jgi:hypothetical protein